MKISNTLEDDGARCPSCATNGFSLCKAPIELKELVWLVEDREHMGNSDFLLCHRNSVDIT